MIEKFTQDFSKYIQKKFGIVTDSQSNKQLEKFVKENIKLFVQPDWQSELSKRDLSDFVNSITITETYFFRDRKQLNVMIDDIRMKLKQKEKTKFNIWSMGCSSGEEPYTISLMLKELQNYESFEYKVKGFDINTKNIEKAKKGTYTSWSFRGTEKNFLIQKYFTQEEDNLFTIKDSVKENVEFSLFNLTEDLFESKIISKYGTPDYIFLRNTIMYFNKETIAKIVSKMYELLSDNGMLIPGIQEVRIFKYGNLSAHYTSDTCVFKKESKINDNKNIITKKIPEYSDNKYTKEFPISSANKFVEKYNKNPIKDISLKTNTSSKNTSLKKDNSSEKQVKNTDKKEVVIETKKNALKLIQSKTSNKKIQVKHIIKSIKLKTDEKELDYTSLIKSSLKSFERGLLDEALSYCSKAEILPESNYIVYYLKSAIKFESNEIEESLKDIRKALFLNSDSALNNYYIAKIMIKKDDYKKAIIHLNKSISLIDNENEIQYLDLLGLSKEDLKKHIQIAFKILEVKNDKLY